MNRKYLTIIGLAVILLVIAVLAVPSLVDVNRYRSQIEAKLEERLGRDVSLGNMRLSLIPLGFRVQNAVIADTPEFQTGRPFAQAKVLYIKPALVPLIRGEFDIHSLELTSPTVELIRNRKGSWNFASLTAAKKKDGQSFSIDQLRIDDGQLAVTDLQQNELRTVYDHIDLILWDFAPDKAFSIDAHAHLPGSGKQTIGFEGNAGPIQRDVVARTPFRGKLDLNEISLASLKSVLKLEALENSDAMLTGTADINNDQGLLASKGKLQGRNLRIHGADIGYPVNADYEIQTDLNQKTLQIQKADLNLGKITLALNGRVDARPTPAVLDLNATTSKGSLAEVARLMAAFGVAFTTDTQVNGSLSLNLHARGPTNKLVMDGEAEARNVDISGGGLRQPVHVDAMDLSLSPNAIQSNEFTATTGRTSVRAQFTLNDYASDAPMIKASASAGNAEVGELLTIARAYGISAVEGVKGTGAADFNVLVTGPMKQSDKLTYSGNGVLRTATFGISSLAKPVTIQNADLRFSANSVILNNLDCTVGQTTARGNLTIQNPAAPRVEFSLALNKIDVREFRALTQTQTGSTRAQDSILPRISGSGRATVDTVVYDQLVLKNVHGSVRLENGIIETNPVDADLYGGKQVGSVVLNLRSEPTTYTVDSKLQNVDANALLSSISSIKDGVYGLLSANAGVRFTAGDETRNIARSLNGRISINLRDGAIANMDVLHEMATIAQFLRIGKPVEPDTKFSELSGDFDISDGVARTNNLTAVMDTGSMAGNGSVDLGQQRLNLHVTAVLSKEYSDSVGGIGIGGLMTTALANEKGEIVVPMIVTGTFQDPQFAPDLQKVAEMKLKQLVPDANNPAELAIGMLGRILGPKPETPEEQSPPQQEQQPADKGKTPEDTLSDVLNRILRNTQKRPGEQPR